MPIEIRELVVRARIDPGDEAEAPPSGASGSGETSRDEDLVRACVQEALRVVELRSER
jgi:Family of unknown function (DUF5908)